MTQGLFDFSCDCSVVIRLETRDDRSIDRLQACLGALLATDERAAIGAQEAEVFVHPRAARHLVRHSRRRVPVRVCAIMCVRV